MTRVSVIIPNYNRASIIGYTIKNMLNQTVLPDEIIVVDDGSTDNSVEVIKSFGGLVQLVEQKNQGPGAARNRGLEIASGQYIQFMDSDDLLSLNKLEVQLKALQNSEADFAYSPWVRTIIKNRSINLRGPILQSKALPDFKSMLEWQLGSWSIIFQNCLFRRETLDCAGKYATDMRIAEDGEYLVRILLTGASSIFTDNCMVFYRTEGEDQITSSASSDERQATDLTKYYDRIGINLGSKLFNISPSTKREVILELFRHNRYCNINGYPSISKSNPLSKILSGYPELYIEFLDKWEVVKRKLLKHPALVPFSPGMQLRDPDHRDYKLAREVEGCLATF